MGIGLQVNAKANGKKLHHFWNVCVGGNLAKAGLYANYQEHLRLAVKECGFRYLRAQNIFHDDMFVYHERKGIPVYHWEYVDALYDSWLDIGIRPFVMLGFCPAELATKLNTVFGFNKAHGSPPNDYNKWGNLVEEFTRHCVARYGLPEVRQWYFEVWNEPNLNDFFSGTKSQYFELYKVSALAVKKVDRQLKVGGPATSNFVPDQRFDGEREDVSKQTTLHVKDLNSLQWKGVWIEDFLKFCQREKAPVDFLSTHPYPTDFALDGHGRYQGRTRSVNATRDDLRWLRRTVDDSSFPDIEIHLTEWNASPTLDYTRDFPQSATFVVKAMLDSIGLVDSLACWTISDVVDEYFPEGERRVYSLVDFRGVVRPYFHAYRFLNRLGDEELARNDGCLVTRSSKTGKLASLLYHYPPEMPDTVPMSIGNSKKAEEVLALGRPEKIKLKLSGLAVGAPVLVETLDQQHGFAHRVWQAMDSPLAPTREQTGALREAGMNTKKEFLRADKTGAFILEREIEPWSIVLVKEM